MVLFQGLFFVAMAVIGLALAAALVMIARRPLKPAARNLLIVLLVLEVVTALLHVAALDDTFPRFWDWFFNLQYELNLGSIFSALQLAVIALIAMILGAYTPQLKWWQRLYWALAAVIFTFLALDEWFSFHETLGGGHVVTEFWRIPYAIGGALFLAISAVVWWFGFRRQWRVFGMMIVGLVVMVAAGVGIEEFVLRGFVEADPRAEWLYMFEEVGEMIGATIVLVTLMSAAQEWLSERGWRTGFRWVVAGTAAFFGVMLVSWLVYPAFEARFLARPVQVDYANGISLIGFDASEVARPGDELPIILNWRTDAPLDTDYSLSIHLLSHPNVDSVAQSDDLNMGPIPSSAWFPGVPLRHTVYMRIPDDLPTPASYWIMVRVWYGPWPLGRPWQDTTGVEVTRADGVERLAFDAVILGHVTALPDTPPEPPSAGAVSYPFPDTGFTLEGAALPAEPVTGRTLSVRFWWSVARDVEPRLSQLFHLVPVGGEGEVNAFDQEPFGGRLPTNDWPAGMRVHDDWAVTLPDTLAPGRYEVYTGMYDAATLARAAVTDAAGAPVPNNAILLGTIDYRPTDEAAA